MSGFISINRQITSWEWYTDNNVKSLFIHCLLKANFKDNTWRGIDIKRGSFITSTNTLSNELNLSVQKIRTALNKLESTSEITIKTTNKNTLVTVINYDKFQDNQQTNNKQITNKQQTDNKQITTTNKENKENNDINDNKKEKVYSKEIHDTLLECLKHFPLHLHPKNKDSWLDVIEKLNRIDSLPLENIIEVVKNTRADDFWSKNFLSMTKLRKSNKDGLKYIVVFNEQTKNNGTSKNKSNKSTSEMYAEQQARYAGKGI